ncbi:ferrochelatase [Microbacteriaceae bacterium MWH-Ta3]|nr:ferrochelatase [Microbacteriaceae bacterium MWH-Ta3]
MSYDAILLTSFGGPEGPDDVMPYLERVTAGRGVPYDRLVEVSHHYMALGGVSPINEQNRQLLSAMRERFPERGINIPIYWGNRNSAPYFADVVKEMFDAGHRRVLAWVTSAYSSYSGCRQYRENLHEALATHNLVAQMTIDKVRHYFDHPGFLTPVIEGVSSALRETLDAGHGTENTVVLFATHSIPSAMGETSGPPHRRTEFSMPGGAYAAQHEAAAQVVMNAVLSEHGSSTVDWQLVYQSRSGSPHVPWLEPDVNDAIAEAARQGKSAVIVVPIGFVSDHVEVIWDLDNEAKETAQQFGVMFRRTPTPGTHPAFVDGIASLVLERLSAAPKQALTNLGPWPGQCAVGCCPNLRRELPVISEG